MGKFIFDIIAFSLKNDTRLEIIFDSKSILKGRLFHNRNVLRQNEFFRGLFIARIGLADERKAAPSDFFINFRSDGRLTKFSWNYYSDLKQRTAPAYSDSEGFNLLLDQSQPTPVFGERVRYTKVSGRFWSRD